MGAEHAISHFTARRAGGHQHVAILDMQSAYDVAPRDIIVKLAKRRLPQDMAGMISCPLSPGRIFVTGAPESRIDVTSGVMQGDPVCPTLFNMLMEDLLETIDQRIGPAVRPASCYADDVLLMSESRTALQ